MKFKCPILIVTSCAYMLAAPLLSSGQSAGVPKNAEAASSGAATPEAIHKKIEDYLRNQYGWDDTFKLTFSPFEQTGVPDIEKITVTVTSNGQSDGAAIFVSKDGRYMFRGEMEELPADPFAAVRAQINLSDSPAKGPANAATVIVEYGDFQCPVCKSADLSLREILPKFSDARFVFKDYPLVDIHPWAMTAALAGRCAYQQSNDGFWKFHDLIYDNQAGISAANAWDKMQEFATQVGLDATALRACMADPKTHSAVAASIAEGQKLHVANTPTFFINGHRQIGLDPTSFTSTITGSVRILKPH
jgi:protein-disulfide isomerase